MSNTSGCNIVVLISGSGSNLEAIIDHVKSGQIDGTIQAVISNRPDAYGLTRAKNHDIEAVSLDHKTFASREAYDQALAEVINRYDPDLIVLAGFMRILTPGFVQQFEGRMLNIHPSLLPKYPGLDTHQRALDAGDKQHGSTVHFVTAELDGGPIIKQSVLEINSDDSAERLTERVKALEHELYPEVIGLFSQKRLKITPDGVLIDGKPIHLSVN